MKSSRQQAGLPHGLPLLVGFILTSAFLVEVINGQPTYYLKAPAVKSLPRIGRRSDGESGGGRIGTGSETPASMLLPRSGSDFSGGVMDIWQGTNNPSSNIVGGTGDSYGGHSPFAPASISNQLEKAILWRRLLADGNANFYDEAIENMYRSKS